MSVAEWVAQAPEDIKRVLSNPIVLGFLYGHRNVLFQLPGTYDGAMSEPCKDVFRRDEKALGELLDSLMHKV